MDPYKKKYLKYKAKYLSSKDLLEQEGGADFFLGTEDIYDNLSEELKAQASIEGKRLLDNWLKIENKNIEKVTKLFDENGELTDGLSASTFSDYYKWTMMPVIWFLHTFITAKTGESTFKVTFGIDIRDENMRKAINSDKELRNKIVKALEKLAARKFDKQIFDDMNRDSTLLNNTLIKDCINYICDGNTLAIPVKFNEDGSKPVYTEDDNVHISFYKVTGAKYNDDDTEDGLWFIEARGPWPRVTWLETSMMQAVYEAYLRYNLEKEVLRYNLDKAAEKKITSQIAYQRWLYGALLRCARSVAFTRLVQTIDPKKPMTPALFTGRRTGGYLFLLLQNLFFAHHFNQFTLTGQVVDIYGKTRCLGTSSIDSYFQLQKLGLPFLRPVGTHAHELSMVISVLFPYFDKNKYDLPLTQIIGHELYRILSANTRPGPAGVMFPMLPDTLGTAAFMKAATWVKMPDDTSFISKITSARQDSGKLENFKKLMEDWDYKQGMMASEIDNTQTLLNATKIGFSTSGAGGFYGDSGKVWNPSVSSPSMAVKAVNVEYCVPASEKQFYEGLEFPHIIIADKDDKCHVKGYPIKVGDPEDMKQPALAEGKLSLDKTLPADKIKAIKTWVSNRRIRAFSNIDNDNENIKADRLDITLFTGDNLTPTQKFLATIR